jgi:hypothetical protein
MPAPQRRSAYLGDVGTAVLAELREDPAAARAAMGLGAAATRSVGTASGTVAAGDDARFNRNVVYVSDYIPPGFDTTSASCYTYIMQAVTAAGVGGKIVFNGRFRCDTEIALLNFQTVSGLTDWLAAGGGIQTSCVDFRQVTANAAQGDTKVGFRYAASNYFELLMIAGPGTDVAGSRGVSPLTGTEYAPRFNRVSFYNWEHGAHLEGAYYSDFIDCSWQLNAVGVYAASCYNLSFYKPRMRCSNIDLTSFGVGIEISGFVRGLKILGGSIENYLTAVKGASFSDVSAVGTYFEMFNAPAGAFAGATTFDFASKTNCAISVHDCTVYLHRHLSFVNGNGGGLSVLAASGNQFIYSDMGLNPAPTVPFAYNILSSFGDVDLGPDNWRLVFYDATRQTSGYTPNIWGSGALLDYKVTFPRGDATGRDAHHYIGRNIVMRSDKYLAVGGLRCFEAANGKQGVATLVAGTVTVANTSITAVSRIQLTIQALGTVAAPKAIGVTARVVGASFTITSADATDTSVIAYEIFEPA